MLRIGLTPESLIDMPEESRGSLGINPRSSVEEISNTDGSLFVRGNGKTLPTLSLNFELLTKAEKDLITQFAVPYVFIPVWAEYSNSSGVILYEGLSYVKMTDEEVDYDDYKFSFKLKISLCD